jgi:hypothetical protein
VCSGFGFLARHRRGTLARVQVPRTASPRQVECALHQALGAGEWERLAPAVQRAHELGIEHVGRFRIEHGGNVLSRLLARLVRVPPQAPDVEARLVIVAGDDEETWQRSFGGRPFLTTQRREADSIVERWRCVEIRFHPRIEAAALRYEQVGACLRAGALRIRLPRCLAPRVQACESPATGDSVRVRVAVTLPLVGLLIAYDGVVGTSR